MKLNKIVRAVAVSAVLFSPALVLAAVSVTAGVSNKGSFFGISIGSGSNIGTCSSTICGIGDTILYLINDVLVPVLFAVSFIVFLWGIAKAYIIDVGNESEREKGHKLVLWGLIAFAVMVSIWGLVNIVANTFGLTGYYAPSLPTSY